jgi:hypothetical protein
MHAVCWPTTIYGNSYKMCRFIGLEQWDAESPAFIVSFLSVLQWRSYEI